jgi:hypothetical protein
MTEEFEDIKIVAFNDQATRRGDPNLALMHLVLELSASAPHAWAQYFNECWHSHFYMMKREASVSGDRLEIYCVPDELEKHHIAELKKVISQTNQAYRQYLAQRQQAAEARAAKESEERANLAEIKSRLKFD